MTITYIRRLEALGHNDIGIAGGKGANLGEMLQAGLPVPPGFVVTTSAYWEFVQSNGLQADIERLANEARAEDPESVEAASVHIRALFTRSPASATLINAILTAYQNLGRCRVAVRSSATAEDLPSASFAGQQESYLNIEGEEPLLEAVQHCFSSLWTGRAIAYRIRHSISPANVALAVVVQQQVDADIAGILFTANPVTGRRDQMVIDGSWGLGEAVVSGQVTPDRWVVDTESGRPVENLTARKLVMTVRTAGGTATVSVPDHLQESPILDSTQAAELVALGRQVAAHFSSPQDIEWARAGNRVYLLQSRPITSLFPLPVPEPEPGSGLRAYISFQTLQGLVEPFTPMGIELFRYLARGPATLMGYPPPPGKGPAAFKEAAGRIYLDVTDRLKDPKTQRMITKLPAIIDRQTSEILTALTAREAELTRPTDLFPIHPRVGLLLKLAFRASEALLSPESGRRKVEGAMERLLQELQRDAEKLTDVAGASRFFAELPASLIQRGLLRLVPVIAAGLGCRFLAEAKLQQWIGDGAALQPVLRALPHNPTTEMDLELWRLSRRLKAEGAEPAVEHPGVQAFLKQYGHRTVREIDVGMERWRDNPTHVLNILRTYLTHPADADPDAHFRKGLEEAARAVESLVARVRREKGLVHSWLMRFMLSRVRALAGMREFPKFTAVRFIALQRQILQKAGARLAAAGRLERADDIFFLHLSDLELKCDLRPRAAMNWAAYQQEMGRRNIPRVMTSLGETFYASPASREGGLTGTAASPGVYEGVVRVIHDPRGAKLIPGEILVAPGTDPAWTPLFLSAGALVMEIGGTMSHGSVVAREYGIPAVVGVTGATQVLKTGQRVRVDGESGVVVPLDLCAKK